MNPISFWRQIGLGLGLSLVASVIFLATTPVLGAAIAARGLVLGLGAVYLGWLLHQLRARIGLVVSAAAWMLATVLLIAFHPSLWLWIGVQTLLIWLLRCLYRYDSLGSAMLDAALSAFALAAALVTARYTHSGFLTLWTWFLVQALFVFIPPSRQAATPEPDFDDAFGQAHRTAEAALRRLSLRH